MPQMPNLSELCCISNCYSTCTNAQFARAVLHHNPSMVLTRACCDAQGGCGNPVLSALFFCSFTVIITMILLNLFTAVVLENFEIQEEQAEWTLTPAALEVQDRC